MINNNENYVKCISETIQDFNDYAYSQNLSIASYVTENFTLSDYRKIQRAIENLQMFIKAFDKEYSIEDFKLNIE